MVQQTLLGWQPPTEDLNWYQPVQVEDASRGISVCSLPNNQAIIMWPTSTEVHYAVVPSTSFLLGTNVVTAPMVQTALTALAVYRVSVFTYGGEVYFAVLGDTTSPSDRFWVRIYKADDPNDPVIWSLHGTVAAGINYDFLDFGGNHGVGIPAVTDSGRWVMTACKAYRTPFGGGGFCARDTGIWTSDDSGVNWTLRATFSHSGFTHRSDYSAPQITEIPSSGDLLSSYPFDANFTDSVTSSDDGTNWSAPGFTGGDDEAFCPFLNNGTSAYGMNAFDTEGKMIELDGTNWVEVAQIWPGVGGSGTFREVTNEGQMLKFIVDRDADLLYCAGAFYSAEINHCAPVSPSVLHIPFKDRLAGLIHGFSEPGIARAVSQQFENWKVIERWAQDWMTLAGSSSRCRLQVPFKDHSRSEDLALSAAQSFENWKVVERWGQQVAAGECGCSCHPEPGADPPPDRCQLFIPFKSHLLDRNLLEPMDLEIAAGEEFDNFKTLERWATLYSSGTCGCTVT